ncbi:hypothetical protein Hanom_Chr03g00278241 [Helianthus anomalus]
MVLTWATGVCFGHVTRRNDRENELHPAANAYGGLGHRSGPKTLISISYLSFYVFLRYFVHFVFWLVFGPWLFCGPFSNFCIFFICFSCKLDGQKSIWNLLIFHFKISALWIEF